MGGALYVITHSPIFKTILLLFLFAEAFHFRMEANYKDYLVQSPWEKWRLWEGKWFAQCHPTSYWKRQLQAQVCGSSPTPFFFSNFNQAQVSQELEINEGQTVSSTYKVQPVGHAQEARAQGRGIHGFQWRWCGTEERDLFSRRQARLRGKGLTMELGASLCPMVERYMLAVRWKELLVLSMVFLILIWIRLPLLSFSEG